MTSDDNLETLLRSVRADRFTPGFVDRVMQRLAAAPTITLGAALPSLMFEWLMPAWCSPSCSSDFSTRRRPATTVLRWMPRWDCRK